MPAVHPIKDSLHKLGGLLLAAVLLPVAAQDLALEETEPLERFEVEFLIFAYRDVIANGEALSPRPKPAPPSPTPSLDVVEEIAPPTIARLPEGIPPTIRVQNLLNGQLLMTDEQQRIQRVDAYNLLLHAGFSQEGVAEEWAAPVSVRRLGAPTQLDGTIRLHRGRFLHIRLDLTLDTNTGLQNFSQPYRLKQQRRLRSGEVHYFDHPAFGVVLTVRLEPKPEPETETETTEVNAPAQS